MDIEVNGRRQAVADAWQDDRLRWVLREHLGLTGTKHGCGQGLCGACTVLVDGTPQRSCQLTVASVRGRAITTIEDLAGADGRGGLRQWRCGPAALRAPVSRPHRPHARAVPGAVRPTDRRPRGAQSKRQSPVTRCPTRSRRPSPSSTMAFMPKVSAPFRRRSAR